MCPNVKKHEFVHEYVFRELLGHIEDLLQKPQNLLSYLKINRCTLTIKNFTSRIIRISAGVIETILLYIEIKQAIWLVY